MKHLITIPLQSGKKLCFDPQPLVNFFNASHGENPQVKSKQFADAMKLVFDELRKTNETLAFDFVAVAHAIITNCTVT
jgi:hypothetical protein